jgi:hypothetical protein
VCYWFSRRRCCWRVGGFGGACYCFFGAGVLASCGGGGAPRWSGVGGFFLSVFVFSGRFPTPAVLVFSGAGSRLEVWFVSGAPVVC